MNPRRRRRKFLKALNCWVRPETYSFLADYLDSDYSLGMAVDKLVNDLREAKGEPPLKPTPRLQ